jgi:DNA polymerase I-like protein with 3'-5' exonuclease and polymerase domains
MKSMPTFISMEQIGVAIDQNHAQKIYDKYHALADKMQQNLEEVCKPYQEMIDEYKRRHPMCKLTDPINYGSQTQLAIIFYDILGLKSPDPKNPRGTGAEILEQLDHPIARAVSDNRSFSKVLSAFIDTLPDQAKKYPDKRIHCSFKQYGAATGRVSCKSPNLQQIPSRPFVLSDGTEIDSGHDVRQLFTASDGYVLMSCDYSGQEVRVTAHLSQDEKLIQAYRDGKDPYCEIASLAFGVPYEECTEYRADGTFNPDGKKRRGEAKKIVLGVLYGRGIPSIAEQLHKTVQEAQKVYDSVLAKFDGLARCLEESEDMARKYGYVTTVWGRRRQLKDMMLPYYEFGYKNGYAPDFDPLSDDSSDVSTEVPIEVVEVLTNKLLNCWSFKKREELKEKIRQKGYTIKDNSSYINRAKRQTMNARVQGSAADLTKLAQIELFNNEELKKLGFRMLIPVHDEIIAECPIENVKRCSELMSQCMLDAGRNLCVPLSCDVALFKSWYGRELKIDENGDLV